LLLKRGECAAIIGPNGAGKTTFLKTLLAQMPPFSGDVILGASLNLGYFAQAHEGLDSNHTLVEEIESVAPEMLLAEIRDYLARFLFSGDEVFKKVAVLSGGERGRVALAKLALTEANLLLLDEPTNHLDIPSQEILQEVLDGYRGTILLVSHDRYLIDALGTQIWEIEPDEASLRVFEGTYSQYRAQREAENTAQDAIHQVVVSKHSRKQKRSTSDDRRRQARIQEVESLISTLEAQLDTLTRRLENPPADPTKVEKLGQEYVRVQGEMENLLSEWEGLHQ
jgi:ATP-binding cassette subfamily F protein 3